MTLSIRKGNGRYWINGRTTFQGKFAGRVFTVGMGKWFLMWMTIP
jgi:hypothetical protein